MTVKEQCFLEHVQNCHICDDMDCCDNINPVVAKYKQLESENATLKGAMRTLAMISAQRIHCADICSMVEREKDCTQKDCIKKQIDYALAHPTEGDDNGF